MLTALLWTLVVLLIVVGLAGIVVPVLPGTALIFAGILVGAWIGDFAEIGGWTLALTGFLTLVSFACDYLAAVLGAKRLGASRQAVFGAAIGTVLGIFSGLWGLLFMPLAGAALGEFFVLRDLRRAGQVGVATAVGLLVGTAVKIAIAFTMVGIFVAALVI